MKLFIQIKDGKPFEHPIMEENFVSAFPDVDLNNLPPQFAKFERVQRPILGPYQVFVSENPDYELDGDTWKDVWRIRDMSNEEKVAHIQTVKTNWGAMPDAQNFSAWVFDEATCSYLPPLPRPNDGKRYFWQGTTTSWVELPPYPEDGKPYRLDVASATWVEVAA
jgi:hypothetical protein